MKKIILTGHCGKNPETKLAPNGDQFVTFSIGISVGTVKAPKTDWAEISCNGKLGDSIMQYLKKGTKVLIEGFPKADAYINKEGNAVGTLRVYANNVEFLSNKQHNSTNDEIPF